MPQKYRLTPEGRRRLQEAAARNRPWEHSTGPTTAEGKARCAASHTTGRREPPAPESLTDPNVIREQIVDAEFKLAGLRQYSGLAPPLRERIAALELRLVELAADDGGAP